VIEEFPINVEDVLNVKDAKFKPSMSDVARLAVPQYMQIEKEKIRQRNIIKNWGKNTEKLQEIVRGAPLQ